MAVKLNDIQRAKLELRFRQMDGNGSGYLECCDYEAMADRLITASGVEIASEAALAMRRYALAMWEALADRLKTGGDGRIGLDEWIASVTAATDCREAYHRVIGLMMRHIVAMFDGDGDGVLDLAEYCALFTSCGLTRAEAESAFRRIDADGDGRLSVDEIDAAVYDFFTSPAADAPGSWAFGPVYASGAKGSGGALSRAPSARTPQVSAPRAARR